MIIKEDGSRWIYRRKKLRFNPRPKYRPCPQLSRGPRPGTYVKDGIVFSTQKPTTATLTAPKQL
jgi:hypothetical protein